MAFKVSKNSFGIREFIFIKTWKNKAKNAFTDFFDCLKKQKETDELINENWDSTVLTISIFSLALTKKALNFINAFNKNTF